MGQLFMRDLRNLSNLPRERDGTLDSRSFRHDCFRDSFTERLGLYMFQNSLRVQCLIFIPHASLNVPELAFRMHTASDTEMHSHKCLAFGPPWFVGGWLSRVASNQTVRKRNQSGPLARRAGVGRHAKHGTGSKLPLLRLSNN